VINKSWQTEVKKVLCKAVGQQKSADRDGKGVIQSQRSTKDGSQ
jgi:hypothetical protein